MYQGDMVISGEETHYFVARKGEKWRYDIVVGDKPVTSELHSDKIYKIDHKTKTFREITNGSRGISLEGSDGLPNFFRGYEHRDFDEISRDGKLVRYKVRDDGSAKSDVFVTIDTSSGLMIKQEFMSPDKQSPDFVYEIKDLKMEVDDSVFDIPQGYTKLTAK